MSVNISGDNLNALSKCDLTTQIIGIRSRKDNREIVILSKNDVTVVQRILSCIGKGKLAGIEIDPVKVASLLSQYSWTNNATQRQDSIEYRGYQKACQFANKVFLSKKDKTLLYAVSKELKIENAFLTQIRKGNKAKQSSVINPTVVWNPEMQYKHINTQLQHIFYNSSVLIELNENEGEVCMDASEKVCRIKDFSELTFQVIQILR